MDEFDELADEVIRRCREVHCRDKRHVAGIRRIRDRLERELAVLESFDRSGVTTGFREAWDSVSPFDPC